MNCEPGDMAVVVSGNNLGLIVEVLGVSAYYGPPFWSVRAAWPALGTFPEGHVQWVKNGSIHDARLRPIRPDAVQPVTEEPETVPA